MKNDTPNENMERVSCVHKGKMLHQAKPEKPKYRPNAEENQTATRATDSLQRQPGLLQRNRLVDVLEEHPGRDAPPDVPGEPQERPGPEVRRRLPRHHAPEPHEVHVVRTPSLRVRGHERGGGRGGIRRRGTPLRRVTATAAAPGSHFVSPARGRRCSRRRVSAVV